MRFTILRQYLCNGRSILFVQRAEMATTKFGFQDVTESEKANKVQATFTSVASKYDIMNDAMSLKLHRLWKDYFVQSLKLPDNVKILDVAGGTGDIAIRMKNYMNCSEGIKVSNTVVTVLDINNDMLRHGVCKQQSAGITWTHGNALQLPFRSDYFDVYTVVFGVRNVASYEQMIREAIRVLVPGGMFVCMEFTIMSNPWIRRLYDLYSFNVIPVLGELISQDRHAYQYLVESIRTFPCKEDFVNILKDNGLCKIQLETIAGGTVAIYKGFKPLKKDKIMYQEVV